MDAGSAECTLCHRVKNAEHFARDTARPSGLRSYCKPCANNQKRQWRYQKQYGLAYDDYLDMLYRQKWCCASCGDFVGRDGCVDHNHKTGKIRGILCSGCNKAEGLLRGDATRMRRLAAYTEMHDAI